MRALVMVVVVAACGSPSAPVIGEVAVHARTNSARFTKGTTAIVPIPGLSVFVEGTEDVVVTDADGRATLPVTAELSTIHVVNGQSLISIVDAAPGAQIELGGRTVKALQIAASVALPAVAGATYTVRVPVQCGDDTSAQMPSVFLEGDPSACHAARVYGFAATATSTQWVERDVDLRTSPGAPIMLSGPYRDAPQVTFELTGTPAGATMQTITPAYVAGDDFTRAGAPATSSVGTPAVTHVATDANLLRVDVTDSAMHASMLVRHGPVGMGTVALDASAMLPFPMVTGFDDRSISWELDAQGHEVDDVIVLARLTASSSTWRVIGPPTMRSVHLPTLPSSLAGVITGPVQPVQVMALDVAGTTDRQLDAIDTLIALVLSDRGGLSGRDVAISFEGPGLP